MDDPVPEAYAVKDVTPRVRHETNVYVPHVDDLTQSQSAGEDGERLEALFEWVGMACLGAQRYVARNDLLTADDNGQIARQ